MNIAINCPDIIICCIALFFIIASSLLKLAQREESGPKYQVVQEVRWCQRSSSLHWMMIRFEFQEEETFKESTIALGSKSDLSRTIARHPTCICKVAAIYSKAWQ